MADAREVLGVVALLDVVLIGALLLVVGPLDAVAPIVPVVLFFSAVLGLYAYRS